MRILLLTPPLVQLNTPYPATAYLMGFLGLHAEARDLTVAQADPGLELFLRLFSRAGLTAMAAELAGTEPATEAVASFVEQADRYIDTVDAAIRFLQGRDPSLMHRIASREFLPEGARFAVIEEASAAANGEYGDGGDPLGWAFGALGHDDRAKFIASLFVDDIADMIRDGIDAHFGLSRYAEQLALSAPSYDPIANALAGKPTLVDRILDDIAVELVKLHQPELVCLTAPFPGNVYGALRLAQAIKATSPTTTIALGGGYINTELRELAEPRLFNAIDFVTLDDGEAPLLALIDHLRDHTRPLLRTFVRKADKVEFITTTELHDVPHRDVGTPTYVGLPLNRYLSLFEMLNPMTRLWSDGRWNKLTIAHGCYWRQCTFCDVTLDYIGRYEPTTADILVDRIEAIIAETGQTGFHFVDEAAPPGGLRALAERLLARKVTITWWGNIRFEKTFTPALCKLLAESGCVAITGGLEAASDRLLASMRKGVTVEQVARVTRAFTDAGVMVHAYLMYGFPTQTEDETVDALERVRQLFEAGCIQSAFWHRFAATVHSPIGKKPELFGIRLRPLAVSFARNEVAFEDPVVADHEWLGIGLRRALYNYMHGVGLEADVRSWFDRRPKQRLAATTVPKNLIATALGNC